MPPPLQVTGCSNPTVSNIIKGDFSASGANHGKPVYKKDSRDSPNGVTVLIYYWDDRDGPSFSGWWFGPKVGGDQVWAYNGDKSSPMPPAKNWKVPWDGPVDSALQLIFGSGGGHSASAGGPPPMRDQRQQEEDRRRQEIEKQRALADQRRRDEERARREEESRRKAKEREEEAKRREEEMRRRRKEEEIRQKEQAAALAVRKVIQRVRIATPETYDNLRAELEEAQASQLDTMGSQAEKVSQEAEKALQQAQQRIDEIMEKRAADEKARVEEERRRKEEADKIEKLMKEANEEVSKVDKKIEEAQDMAKSVGDASSMTPEAMIESADKTEKVLASAQEVADAIVESLLEKRKELGDSDAAYRAKKELGDLQAKISGGRRSLDSLASTLRAARDKAAKKSKALKKIESKRAEFAKHDADKDEKLDEKEVLAFSKSVYDFEVPESTLTKIMRSLEPITMEKFQRMRGMVAIAKSEVQARARRAEEAERKRVLEEQRQALLKVVDEANSVLGRAEETMSRAEAKARPLGRDSDGMSAEDMKASAAEIETLVKHCDEELEKADRIIKQVEEDCAASKELKSIERRELPNLKQRHSKMQGRVEKVQATATESHEKAVRKAYAEIDQRMKETVKAIRTHMNAEANTGEQMFDKVNGGDAITKNKFVTFVSSLSDLNLKDHQAEELFKHIAGEQEDIRKDHFLELVRFYYKCVKSTVLTEEISIKSKTLRRLEVGDVLEALEGPKREEGANVDRVRCHCVTDDSMGWVTIAGNQGTPFLEPGGNVMTCIKETVLTDGLSVQDSKTIRRVTRGEVIEVLEFPKNDDSVGVKRIKGKARQDGATGWITVSGNQGTCFLEPC